MDTDSLIRYILTAARADGCVIVEPHMDEFRPVQRTFLDGLKKVPARISAPPTGDPFVRVLANRGRWMMIWIPE